MFTILTAYGSYLVDDRQVERLNAAKRSGEATVHLDVACPCPHHEASLNRVAVALADVVGVVGHSKSRGSSNVVPFPPVARSA